jgi:predicted HTH domain antitoxin
MVSSVILETLTLSSHCIAMRLSIPDDIVRAADLSADRLLQELAVRLYATRRLSFGQARRLAGMDMLAFQAILADSNVTLNYGMDDLDDDVRAIGNAGA